ncbi:fibroblast growth factor-binding protein 1-like [Callorhinchus milii]|uniref:fibroblast growth factor-binding protein 1-like n=1 Tax=Callorhinchus milii TaxID=7868 RepID=UPI001C3FB861|nr:fibroblast growth factor-binding protein 1-like [Callorhinchus milii]
MYKNLSRQSHCQWRGQTWYPHKPDGVMALPRLALLLLLLCAAQQLLLTAGAAARDRGRGKGRGGRRRGKEAATRGKFVNREKAECTWAVSGEGAAAEAAAGSRLLRVQCRQGEADFWCEFSGLPSACAKYRSDAGSYWKQIARALKKQRGLCAAKAALLKTKVCRAGPRAAHLGLSRSSLLPGLGLGRYIISVSAGYGPVEKSDAGHHTVVTKVDIVDCYHVRMQNTAIVLET